MKSGWTKYLWIDQFGRQRHFMAWSWDWWWRRYKMNSETKHSQVKLVFNLIMLTVLAGFVDLTRGRHWDRKRR